MKPFADSCAENRDPILAVLRGYLRAARRLLEIGSGTGQHAVYFAPEFPHLDWQPSERAENLHGIELWREEAGLDNVLPPLELDVTGDWPAGCFDAVFSANTAHIMSWPAVEAMFAGVGRVLEPGGIFMLYGPFNYGGSYTSASNERFDAWLKQRDPASGIRDFSDLDRLARDAGMDLVDDHEMPVNNRTVVWRKSLPQVD